MSKTTLTVLGKVSPLLFIEKYKIFQRVYNTIMQANPKFQLCFTDYSPSVYVPGMEFRCGGEAAEIYLMDVINDYSMTNEAGVIPQGYKAICLFFCTPYTPNLFLRLPELESFEPNDQSIILTAKNH